MTANETGPLAGARSEKLNDAAHEGTEPRQLARDLAGAVATEDAHDRLNRVERLALGQLYALVAIADALAGGDRQ